ncbi:hypothetical protein [Halomonas elongata]|uniref:Uncharacterized protein n=1 Tax=Halomonas elongata (strain ATCC 33173 / DSM 2581 / NBRC 15536 / NCIMB 2198 / 1H9) TaxID=768066 RepID=E1V3X9_HALED|nr:hypothetical protein [Halomonas elongata]WBF16540.1 hypothetical protein LM502_10580 [Halomonas elongata]WPU48981.1 hypothetical protein SR933_08805 [Halomonas elongata DSM 2581]CBV42808.1 uncharacterized protein HELO_2924 [Halomonas elongata DSM 2581]
MSLQQTSYAEDAYRAAAIPPLPESPKLRERMGEDLLPFGDYADIEPYQQLCDDAGVVQYQEKQPPEFYKSQDWWWSHERIRFLKSQMGLSILLMAVPVIWLMTLLGIVWYSTINIPPLLFGREALGAFVTVFMALLGSFAAIVVAVYSSQIVMNFIVWLFHPLRALLHRWFDRYTEDRCSEFNRQTGRVSMAQGKKKTPLVAPFIEFDGYVERVVQRGGVFYKLMLVHRYTGTEFHHTSFSQTVAHKQEVHAQWDMLQRYMDVSQPLPDVPRLEPFRDCDPVTAEHDRKTGRDPRYWRDLDIEAWKEGEGAALLKAQMDYPWQQQRCLLTPRLGQVEMAVYREQRPTSMA